MAGDILEHGVRRLVKLVTKRRGTVESQQLSLGGRRKCCLLLEREITTLSAFYYTN